MSCTAAGGPACSRSQTRTAAWDSRADAVRMWTTGVTSEEHDKRPFGLSKLMFEEEFRTRLCRVREGELAVVAPLLGSKSERASGGIVALHTKGAEGGPHFRPFEAASTTECSSPGSIEGTVASTPSAAAPARIGISSTELRFVQETVAVKVTTADAAGPASGQRTCRARDPRASTLRAEISTTAAGGISSRSTAFDSKASAGCRSVSVS
mmetsp:Transcript_106133/g.187977  ORF Transcript_106133/g.187977 Transcript_106133/m.187977 type:complete len:210 (+) Transcript_106133:533-1162(+)